MPKCKGLFELNYKYDKFPIDRTYLRCIIIKSFMGGVVQFWLERRPVTPEVASSSLVVPAIMKSRA